MFNVKPKIAVDVNNKKKPFKLINTVMYISAYDYCIHINKGYTWNGANIPRFLWRLIGSQYNPEYLEASMVHDWLCENKYFILEHGVKISSDIFRDILIENDVGKFKSNVMGTAVYLFQLTQRGWN